MSNAHTLMTGSAVSDRVILSNEIEAELAAEQPLETERAHEGGANVSVMSTGSAVVDPKDYIEQAKTTPKGSLKSNRARRRAELKDIIDLIRRDDEFAEVTLEQVERVRIMHDRFAEGARFSFNYNTLLLVASVIAGLGLVSDSSTIIIASMLVSPIMGPVVALAYGTSIRDWKMVRSAAEVEAISLLFCVAVGAVIGGITGATTLAESWLTSEMYNRATLSNFLVGIPVAFFSGLGVAVSLLDDQTNSLVGVAISASLLPPAVNCGAIWVAFAFYEKGKYTGDEDEEYTWVTFRRAGLMSLCLTLANIIFIWISSMLMFRLKEVGLRSLFVNAVVPGI